MTDREKIISNDYYDIISDYQLPGGLTGKYPDAVYQPVSGEIGISYIERSQVAPMGISNFSYPAIPKLYGLMQAPAAADFDPTPLIQSGILQAQESSLNLTGRGVVIGFLDTGECVIIMPDRRKIHLIRV